MPRDPQRSRTWPLFERLSSTSTTSSSRTGRSSMTHSAPGRCTLRAHRRPRVRRPQGHLGPRPQPRARVHAPPQQPLQGPARGRDEVALRELFVSTRSTDWPVVFVSTPPPGRVVTQSAAPGGGYYYSASHHSAGQPIVAGWSYQWISQLSFRADGWTAPMDLMRLPLDRDCRHERHERHGEAARQAPCRRCSPW